jgi:hypothetical protein
LRACVGLGQIGESLFVERMVAALSAAFGLLMALRYE